MYYRFEEIKKKFIVIFIERECVLHVFCPGCLSVFLCPVTGDMVPYLNCSGGDYISHHNRYKWGFI